MTLVGKVVVLALLLVGIITWVLVRSVTEINAANVATEKAINDVGMADRQITVDVLMTRIGLLSSFDPVTRDTETLRAAARRLASLCGEGDRLVGQIVAKGDDRERMIEQFKSREAILRNAFTSFDFFSRGLMAMPMEPELKASLSTAETAVTHMMRSRDADVARATSAHLQDLSRLRFEAADQQAYLDGLILHGRLLADLLPEVDAIVARQRDQSMVLLLRSKRDAVRKRGQIRQQRAGVLLVGLYSMAVVVAALLVRAGSTLQKRTRALRSMILVEHVTARVSNLFMSCQPDEIDQQFEGMLKLLGQGFDADRAVFLSFEGPQPTWIWQRDGVETPDGWPGAIRGELAAIEAFPEAALRVPGRAFRPSPALRQQLASARVRHWSCAKVTREGQTVGLLCFDQSKPLPSDLGDSDDALKMLADIIGHALLRQLLYKRHRLLEGKLRRAERLEAIGTFASGIAHNFNNVLGVIAGQVEMASDALADEAAASGHVRQIRHASQRAQEMVGKILAFGRPERRDLRPVSVAAIVTEALAQIRASAGEDATLTVIGTELEAVTLASETQLLQVFVNIVQNAVQASAAEVPVSIELESIASGPLTLSHGEVAAGIYARVIVTDQGSGMSRATLSRLFQPFFSTKPAGTGLGLATALETVRQAGGAIHVWSATGRGSRFEIWLPQFKRQLPAATARTLAVMLINPDRQAIVEDEELLAALGCEPIGFDDPTAALKMLKTDPDRFDAAIVEHVAAARWTGLQLVRAVRDLLPADRPMLLSTTSTDIDATILTRLGVTDLVRRPWQSAALTASLQALRTRPAHSVSLAGEPLGERIVG